MRDKLLFLGYAVATAGASVAASRGLISVDELVQIQAVLTAFATAFHIPDAKAKAALSEAKEARETLAELRPSAPPASVA
jgi:hypothetical protein